MRTLTKIQKLILVLAFLPVVFLTASPVFAKGGGGSTGSTPTPSTTISGPAACNKQKPTASSLKSCLKQNPIIGDLNTVVNFLSAAAGIVIVGSIIAGGIQYSMAGNTPNAVSAAKKRITDSLIALLIFFFIFAFLQWLIPGGLLFS